MIKTSDIDIRLVCGHHTTYDKIKEPCNICNKKSDLIQDIEGDLHDEYDSLLIKLFDILRRENLNITARLVVNDGVLVLHVTDTKKGKEYYLKTPQVHELFEKLTTRITDWQKLALRGKSVLRGIFDSEYERRYFDSMGTLIPLWKVWLKKRPVSVMTTAVLVIISGALAVVL